MTLGEFNDDEPTRVRSVLLNCCGSEEWADQMLSTRPFSSFEALCEAGDQIWWSLDHADWLQAFSKHPKIGDRKKLSTWSTEEQRGMDTASDDVSTRLGQENMEYEQKFGWIFLICATGRSASEMLGELERRLQRDRTSELRTAAEEQAKITRLRLQKAFGL